MALEQNFGVEGAYVQYAGTEHHAEVHASHCELENVKYKEGY